MTAREAARSLLRSGWVRAALVVSASLLVTVGVLMVAGPWLGSAAAASLRDPVSVVAQRAPAPARSFDAVLTNIRTWIMGIATAVATVFITVGAVRYMAAGGDLGEVEKAKSAFRSAAFGYGIAVLAPLVVSVLSGIVGAG